MGEWCYILGEGYKAVRIVLLLLQKSCCHHRGRICLSIKLTQREEGSPSSLDGKASACNAGDPGSIPGSGRSPGERNGNPLQYSCLPAPHHPKEGLKETFRTSLVAQMVKHLPIVRETWVQSLGQEDLLEKEMETHSIILAWKIPWMEEPG